MKVKLVVLLAICLIGSVLTNAQNPCDSVLVFTGKNVYSKVTLETREIWAYHQLCNLNYKDGDSAFKLGIESRVKQVPIGIDLFSSNKQARISNFCDTRKGFETQLSAADLFETTVFAPSIRAWSECNFLNSRNLKITPKLANELIPAFDILNNTSNNDLRIAGVEPSDDSVVCRFMPIEEPTLTNERMIKTLKKGEAVTISCVRGKVTVRKDEQNLQVLPATAISIYTSEGSYQINFPEKSDVSLTDLKANQILQEINNLKNQLLSSNISSSNNCLRINRTQICWGSQTITPAGPYPNYHYANFAFTFSTPFSQPPTITTGFNINDGGAPHAYVFRNTVNLTGYSGQLTHDGGTNKIQIPDGTMSFIAIGPFNE